MSNFFQSFFCCETSREVLDFEEKEKLKTQNAQTLIYSDINSNNKQHPQNTPFEAKLIEDKYLLLLEKKHLAPMTKDRIIEFIHQLEELPKGFKIYESATLKLFVNKDGSSLSKDTYLGCSVFSISKSELYKENQLHYTLEDLNDFFINPSKRLNWDTGLYKQEVVREESQGIDCSTIILHAVFNSPIVGVSKRDMVDKRIIFQQNGSLYCFQSSIEEKLGKELVTPQDNFVRAMSYLNTTRIWEDETNYYMISFNQTDLRLIIPEAFLQMAVPFTVKKFYKAYVQAIQNSFLS